MTPKGTLAYLAGLLVLCGGVGCAALVVLYAIVDDARPQQVVATLMIVSAIFVFVAAHLLAAGLYRMLTHLYRAISRTDPASDRALRGTRIFLLGQIAIAMAVPTSIMFLAVPELNVRRNERGIVLLLAGLPATFFLIASVVTFFVGLGLMVRDIFMRHRDIVERREAARRRRLDEADETHTEIIPTVLPAELRAHVKEDR